MDTLAAIDYYSLGMFSHILIIKWEDRINLFLYKIINFDISISVIISKRVYKSMLKEDYLDRILSICYNWS